MNEYRSCIFIKLKVWIIIVNERLLEPDNNIALPVHFGASPLALAAENTKGKHTKFRLFI